MNNQIHEPTSIQKIESMVDIPPCPTLFCNNINTRYNVRTLIVCLEEFFAPYGDVIEIVARKDGNRRGQAFVVFEDVTSSTIAMKNLQGRPFLEKQIRIAYAKSKSDATAKLDGSFKYASKLRKIKNLNKGPYQIEEKRPLDVPEDQVTRLLVENLPLDITVQALNILFSQYPGYSSSELVQHKGIAFVRFGMPVQANVAKEGLDGFHISPGHKIAISLAKD